MGGYSNMLQLFPVPHVAGVNIALLLLSHQLLLSYAWAAQLAGAADQYGDYSNISSDSCPPSSCGDIKNISYPFRLRGDPHHCGDPQYELQCLNNRTTTVVNISSTTYNVEEIFYESQQIRVVDSSTFQFKRDNTNCSIAISQKTSLIPTLAWDSHAFYEGQPYMVPLSSAYYKSTIVFVNCLAPIDHPSYLKTNYCTTTGNSTNNSSSNFYAIKDRIPMQDFHPLCDVVAKFPITPVGDGIRSTTNSTSTLFTDQILQILVRGFNLSWKEQLSCRDCFAHNQYCIDYDVARGELNSDETLSPALYKRRGRCYDNSVLTVFYNGAIIWTIVWLVTKMVIGVPCFLVFLIYKCKTKHIWMDTTVEEFLVRYKCQTPTRYSYRHVKNMTKGFKEKLGQGGFGSVFKGKLSSGRLVAVKMLTKSSKGDGQDFMNEVATIGRIHHVNVVPLLGFCSEGSKQALIYEFMPNGSLEKHIFSSNSSDHHIVISTDDQPGETTDKSTIDSSRTLSWEKMHEIALGIARGIEYLHRGCDMRILHFDIKPHNILLDENFTPKVSDFGLAKLYPTDESFVKTMTAARGTIGYMAPELYYKNIGKVSYKSDVYSYGMLLMEMAARRKNIDVHAENSSQLVFHMWAYDQLQQGGDLLAGMSAGMVNDEEGSAKEIMEKLVIVALWCVQMKPNDRPSMSRVVEMLEGSKHLLSFPPKPFLSSSDRHQPRSRPHEGIDASSSSSSSCTNALNSQLS